MLTDQEKERYYRQLLLAEFDEEKQLLLKNSKVLVVGIGGLGSHAALYLAAAGVGELTIVDYSTNKLTNLPRQTIYNETELGKDKTKLFGEKIKAQNSNARVIELSKKISKNNIDKIITNYYDLVIEASDNFETKFLINDHCVKNNIPYIYAGVLKFHGQVFTWLPGNGCLRCLLKNNPHSNDDISNASIGIINTLPAIVGTIQSNEAIKLLTKTGSLLLNKFLNIDLLNNLFKTISFEINPTCSTCQKEHHG